MKKIQLLKNFGIMLLVAFSITSCTKDLAELNKDPNSNEELNADYMFTNTQMGVYIINGGSQTGVSQFTRFNLLHWMQQEATYNLLTSSGDKYNSEGYGANAWGLYYPYSIKQIGQVIDKLREDPNDVNKLSIARIWRVFIFHRMTDFYGDIPYSEANQGLEGNFTPKYDSQSDIYNDMFKELDEAVNALDASKPSFGPSDLIYGGNITQWKKFGYSLMLRLGMRLTKIKNDVAEQWVKKAISGDLILDNKDLARIQFYDGSLISNRNPYSNYWMELDYINPQDPNNVQGSKISERFINQLKGNSTTTKDPRLNVISVVWVKQPSGLYVKDTTTALQRGMKNGEYSAYPADFETFSEPNPNTVMSYSAPILVLTAAEVHFLLAEAAIRGWYSGGEEKAYDDGVTAAMKQWSLYGSEAAISDDQVNAYLANNPYLTAGSFDQKLDQISTQKWLLFYVDPVENWANWRRTNYPTLIPVNYPGNLTGGRIPRRFIVPQSEELYNNANYMEAKNRQSGDNTLLSRVWWDPE